jgi:small basic protein
LILIPIAALIIGAILAKLLNISATGFVGTYLGIACIAGLDTVLGGVRSAYERKFQTDIFVTGFIANVLIASFIAFLGDKIGTNLYPVVALVMGMRIFGNLGIIRRYLLQEYKDWVQKRADKIEAQQLATQVSPSEVKEV